MPGGWADGSCVWVDACHFQHVACHLWVDVSCFWVDASCYWVCFLAKYMKKTHLPVCPSVHLFMYLAQPPKNTVCPLSSHLSSHPSVCSSQAFTCPCTWHNHPEIQSAHHPPVLPSPIHPSAHPPIHPSTHILGTTTQKHSLPVRVTLS
jgi:hypothetical protein